LSHNGLTGFQLGAGFTNLGILCLEDNKLAKVAFDGLLPGLESLRLGGNELTDIPHEWHDLIGDGINLFLEQNKLSEDFQTTLEKSPYQNSIAIKEILSARIYSGEGDDDECRVLIVGNGRVGKTTMYRKLNGLPTDPDQKSTHGVTIATHPWPPEKSIFNVQFWDFGGQDIYHATHRLFMQSSAVYIIAWDPESEQLPQSVISEEGPYGVYQNFKLPYWLDYVYRSSGGGHRSYRSWQENKSEVPVLVVQTKKQLGEAEPGIGGRLNAYFEDSHTDLSVESIPDKEKPLDDNGYELLEYRLKNALRKAKKDDTAAKSWIELRRKLRERQSSGTKYLELDEYLLLAKKVEQKVGSLGRQPIDIAKTWLHNTGVVFYQETATGPRIILDQRWATKAIYAILQREPENHCAEIQENNGFFTGKALQGYWAPHLTGPGDEELFEEFMLKCEVAYRVNKNDDSDGLSDRLYCAPQLLPKEPRRTRDRDRLLKNIDNYPDEYWHLRLYNEFLHAGIVRRLIIKLHDPEEQDWVWRKGMILADEEDHRALVRTEENDQTIRVSISKSSQHLLNSIATELRELPKLDAPDFIWVSHDGQQWVDLELLRNSEKNDPVTDRDGNALRKEAYQPLVRAFSDQRGIGYDPVGKLKVAAAEPSEESEAMVADTLQSIDLKPQKTNDRPGEQMKINIIPALSAEHEKLDLVDEIKQINRAVNQMGKYIDGQPVGNGHHVSSRDSLDCLMRQFPAELVHFIGHGEQSANVYRPTKREGLGTVGQSAKCGIVLVQPDGKADFVSEDSLFRMCKTWITRTGERQSTRQLKVILLNACYTAEVAERLSTLGLSAIGVKGMLNDKAGIRFAYLFYKHLDQYGMNELAEAFDKAKDQARDIDKDRSRYQLFINGGKHNANQ